MDAKVSGIAVDAVEYYQESGTVRTQFNQDKIHPSLAVIATLAEVMDVDPVELDPLHSSVEPDALDALVCVRDCMPEDTHISFIHEDHEITVSSYGVVTITPGAESTMENSERLAGR